MESKRYSNEIVFALIIAAPFIIWLLTSNAVSTTLFNTIGGAAIALICLTLLFGYRGKSWVATRRLGLYFLIVFGVSLLLTGVLAMTFEGNCGAVGLQPAGESTSGCGALVVLGIVFFVAVPIFLYLGTYFVAKTTMNIVSASIILIVGIMVNVPGALEGSGVFLLLPLVLGSLIIGVPRALYLRKKRDQTS